MNNLEPFDLDRALKSAAGCFVSILMAGAIICIGLGALLMEWLS